MKSEPASARTIRDRVGRRVVVVSGRIVHGVSARARPAVELELEHVVDRLEPAPIRKAAAPIAAWNIMHVA